jgi:hypothetical protein
VTTAWQIVLLDALLVVAWGGQGFTYTGDFRNWRLATIGVAYWIAAASIGAILIGDVALALGYDATDYWFLQREFRVLRWRYGIVGAQLFIAIMTRFSAAHHGHTKG